MNDGEWDEFGGWPIEEQSADDKWNMIAQIVAGAVLGAWGVWCIWP